MQAKLFLSVLAFGVLASTSGCGSKSSSPPRINGDGPVDTKIREGNRAWVEGCLQTAPLNRVIDVDTHSELFCKAPNNYRGAQMRYRISRTQDHLTIALKLRFAVFDDKVTAERESVLLGQARACIPLIREIWSRYAVDFDLRMDSNRHRVEGENLPIVLINLVDANERSNAGTYYARDPEFCQMVAHEIGHTLGLDDEYQDQDCPDRTFVSRERNPYSVMAGILRTWNAAEYFPRHLQQILGDFCKPPTFNFLGIQF